MRANQQTIVPLIMAACLFGFSACSKKEVQEESSPQEIARFERIETGVNAIHEKHGKDLRGIDYDEILEHLGKPNKQLLSEGRGTATWIAKITTKTNSKIVKISVEYKDHQVEKFLRSVVSYNSGKVKIVGDSTRFKQLKEGVQALNARRGKDWRGTGYDEVLEHLGKPNSLFLDGNGTGTAKWNNLGLKGEKRISIDIKFKENRVHVHGLRIESQTSVHEGK
jgi:hypothetical protein